MQKHNKRAFKAVLCFCFFALSALKAERDFLCLKMSAGIAMLLNIRSFWYAKIKIQSTKAKKSDKKSERKNHYEIH